MAKGIQLAGGYGAGGVRDALVEIIAQRLAQQQFEEQKRARAEEESQGRATLAQRAAESAQHGDLARSKLTQEDRQFGETLGLNVKKLGEDTRQFDVSTGENRRQFDEGLGFKKGESVREQGNTERGFGLKERQLTEEERANRAGEGIARQRASGAASGANDPQLGALSEMVLDNPDLLDKMTPTDRTKVLKHIATAKDGAFPNKRNESMRSMLETTQKAIRQLKTMKGREGAVGAPSLTDPGSWTRLLGRDPVAGSDAANYTEYLKTLGAQLTLPRLELMRGTGALSNTDVQMLRESATSLSSSLSDPQFLKELENLDATVTGALDRMGPAGGAPGGGGTPPGGGAGPTDPWELYQRQLKGGR